MLSNLKMAINAKNISTLAVAQVIGTTEKTAYNKLQGNSDFTMPEAMTIKRELFPEYDLMYLFAEDKDETAEAV